MNKELFPVKAEGYYLCGKEGESFLRMHNSDEKHTIPEIIQQAKDIASALNNTWGQGINPEAVSSMRNFVVGFANMMDDSKDCELARCLVKTYGIPDADDKPKKEICGLYVVCTADTTVFDPIRNGEAYKITAYEIDDATGKILKYCLCTRGGTSGWFSASYFGEPRTKESLEGELKAPDDKPKPVFTSADGAEIYPCQTYYRLFHDGTFEERKAEIGKDYKPTLEWMFSTQQALYKAKESLLKPAGPLTDITGMAVTCKTDDCKSLTKGKDYKVVQGNYRDTELVYIHVVNDQGHNKGYYFTTFTEPRVAPEPKVVYCQAPEGCFLTKDKAYTVLNVDFDRAILFITNDRGKNKWYSADMFTAEKPKKRYAKCIKLSPFITIHKDYEIILEEGSCYIIIDDDGERCRKYKTNFSTPYTS